ERYDVQEEKHRRFRYGVQVNSLGLTEAQPENNVYRIALEALAVTLGRSVRARAIQLPAWNEALGLPRPWDQQWSLRLQQVLAFDTDGGILVVDPAVEAERREALERWRAERDQDAVDKALGELARVAKDDTENIMPATIEAARAGATTGEWAQTLREVFGEYRAPTG